MTEIEPVEGVGNGANGAKAPSSILDTLRARRREAVGDRHFDVDVPGYGGLLALRLGPISGSTFTKIRERLEASKSPERDFNLNADVLIAATQDVLGRVGVTDPLQSLGGDEPVRLEDRLGGMLGIEAHGARDLVRQLFDRANAPETAVMRIATEYMDWAAGASREADEDFSQALRPTTS